eukprot:SAG11_NODE_5860_length_1446_cov_1.148478_1_plen_103_part_00
MLLLGELVLSLIIVAKVNYTEIDWGAYVQEVLVTSSHPPTSFKLVKLAAATTSDEKHDPCHLHELRNPQVEGVVVHGDFNYTNLRGGTGPLVYPAGFVCEWP